MKQIHVDLCSASISTISSTYTKSTISSPSTKSTTSNSSTVSSNCNSPETIKTLPLRATSESRYRSNLETTTSDSDSENNWDFGIGDLVIDLDADIQRNGHMFHENEYFTKEKLGKTDIGYNSSVSCDAGMLKMKIMKNGPRGTANKAVNPSATENPVKIIDLGNNTNVRNANPTCKMAANEKVSVKTRPNHKKTAKPTSVSTASVPVGYVPNSSPTQTPTHTEMDPYAFDTDHCDDRITIEDKKIIKVEKVR